MSNINQYLPFGTGAGANVMANADYSALSARVSGFVAGTAQSQQLNTVWRQASVVSAMIGQFIADKAVVDVLDDGDVANLETNFIAALTNMINALITAAGGGGGGGSSAYLPLAGGSMNAGANILLSGGGLVKINGGAVWYPGNQGAGSGMDSDLLDGLQSTQFVRNDVDLVSVANSAISLQRALVSSGIYRGVLNINGKTGQNGGGVLQFQNGAGNTVAADFTLSDDRRTLTWSMFSDAGTTYQAQAKLLDSGELWLRKLAAASLYSGNVAAAIIGLQNQINSIGASPNTGPLDGTSIGSYKVYQDPTGNGIYGDGAALGAAYYNFTGTWVQRGDAWVTTYQVTSGGQTDTYSYHNVMAQRTA